VKLFFRLVSAALLVIGAVTVCVWVWVVFMLSMAGR
jgi:hypothetical protein